MIIIIRHHRWNQSATPPIVTDVNVCLSVSPYVTLVHPAKALGWHEMPFGRDTPVVPSNNVLDRGPSPPWEGGRNPRSKYALQIAAKPLQIADENDDDHHHHYYYHES